MMTGRSSSDEHGCGEFPRLVRAEPDLCLEAFRLHLANELCVPVEQLNPETRFVEDLGFDSVRILELALVLDELGVSAGTDDLQRIQRVEDAYDLYVERTAVWLYGDESKSDALLDVATEPPTNARVLPSLGSRRTQQRPVVRKDYDYLYDLTQRRDPIVFWRHRGRSTGPEAFPGLLWRSVLIQHLILHRPTGSPVGFIAAYDADLRSGTAHLDVVVDPSVLGQGWPYEAAVLFIDHLFRWWPLRKLYAQSLTPLSQSLGGGFRRVFVEEGRLTAHEYVDGSFVNLHVIAATRERWDQHAPRMLERIVDPCTRAMNSPPQVSTKES